MSNNNTEYIERLQAISNWFDQIDTTDLFRLNSLGKFSLEEFIPEFERIKRDLDFAITYAPEVYPTNVQNTLQQFEYIQNELASQIGLEDQDYVNNREGFLTNMRQMVGNLRQFSPPFVTAAVMSRGFLNDEGIRQEYERTIKSIGVEADKSLAEVEKKSKQIINDAERIADRIEKRARATASRISVDEAQRQFRDAQRGFNRKVWTWAGLSLALSTTFIWTAVQYASADIPISEDWDWSILYYTAIRITILTSIGTATAFCFKIFRAHLHLSEKNWHRQRVANSIGAFVESAVTPEQRDLILGQLVESVVQFGNTGLLQGKEDSLYRPKMTIDSFTRTIPHDSSTN